MERSEAKQNTSKTEENENINQKVHDNATLFKIFM